MEKKYEIRADGRIVALREGPWGDAGTVGGFVDGEHNLSQGGNAWIADDARVSEMGYIGNDAWIGGYTRVFGNARVTADARVLGNSVIFDNARVFAYGIVLRDTYLLGNSRIYRPGQYIR